MERSDLLRFVAVITIISISACLPAGAIAQTVQAPPLDSLIAQALRNNPGIRSADMRISGSQARIEQAESWDDP